MLSPDVQRKTEIGHPTRTVRTRRRINAHLADISVHAEVSKHEQPRLPFDTSGPTLVDAMSEVIFAQTLSGGLTYGENRHLWESIYGTGILFLP